MPNGSSVIATSRNQVSLRSPVTADAERLAAIYNSEVDVGVSHYDDRSQSVVEQRKWLQMLHVRKFPAVVAEVGGEIVGFGALTPFHSARGYRFTASVTMYVDHALRQHGIGERMARYLIEAGRTAGFHSILAGVSADNLACHSFIQKLGFNPLGRFREIASRNGRWVDDVCYQLILAND
jgi:phosphinothricin acetyltransferase